VHIHSIVVGEISKSLNKTTIEGFLESLAANFCCKNEKNRGKAKRTSSAVDGDDE